MFVTDRQHNIHTCMKVLDHYVVTTINVGHIIFFWFPSTINIVVFLPVVRGRLIIFYIEALIGMIKKISVIYVSIIKF